MWTKVLCHFFMAGSVFNYTSNAVNYKLIITTIAETNKQCNNTEKHFSTC